ncbi:uncharacterized protein LOC135617901 isoform X1 [Musa acuminata AAA Group]|uniref:(wild Malaysian banana) hypothetical protein n=1 Tax=Musa acuminata subsp. malaccensis TaxID=214687 RepID=A0A804I985_MUSAM|nr:PREDICTED: esterase AGAP003155-like [Musa acuminata subsp. malaccensis]CAG1849373.1 unnamed protein product [Musa acuminata subsp. malaccensis]
MGSIGEQESGKSGRRKPRFLCLHGFRTSGEIMRAQLVAKWPEQVISRLDLVFPDAPFPAGGKSEVDGIFPPPYYEWYQYDKDFMVYTNLDKAFARVEELMIEQGPFDGLMGFSQGAILSAALASLQSKGLALTTVPKLKYLVFMGGAMFKAPEVVERVYSAAKIDCTSLHFIGEKDFLKKNGEQLLGKFVDPYLIRHPRGHTVPRLDDEESLKTMLEFLQKIEGDLCEDAAAVDDACKEECSA